MGSGGLDGEVAQVQFLLVGKYSMVFSGKCSSRASLFQIKVGQGQIHYMVLYLLVTNFCQLPTY